MAENRLRIGQIGRPDGNKQKDRNILAARMWSCSKVKVKSNLLKFAYILH